MNKLKQLIEREFLTLLIIVSLVVAITILASLYISLLFSVTPGRDGLYYVNFYKAMVGIFYMGFSVYAFYGPEAYKVGLFPPLFPSKRLPLRVITVYFVVGVAIFLASLRVYTTDPAVVLFNQIVAYSILFTLAVSYAVYYYSAGWREYDGAAVDEKHP